MGNYSIFNNVINQIEIECRRNPVNETGGILVGTQSGQTTFITHCSGPGIEWSSSYQHFKKDTNYVQLVLNFLHGYFGVNYLGLWHKHPTEYPTPSEGDIGNAMDEISDPDIGLDELLIPICVLSGDKVSISPFAVSANGVRQINWNVVSDNQITTFHLWDKHWYEMPIGMGRLEEEVRLLENLKLSVEVSGRDDGRCCIRVNGDRLENRELLFVCPPDYPVTPPDVAIFDRKTQSYLPVLTQNVRSWNLHRHMDDLVKELSFI
tara:strand:+ start:2526 stop:3317 length:792 start_codon:yes stop_codon:yes gene_type:complete